MAAIGEREPSTRAWRQRQQLRASRPVPEFRSTIRAGPFRTRTGGKRGQVDALGVINSLGMRRSAYHLNRHGCLILRYEYPFRSNRVPRGVRSGPIS